MAKVNLVQLQKNLIGVDYPISKKDLIMHAEQTGADEKVLRALKQLPNEQYETTADVSKALAESG